MTATRPTRSQKCGAYKHISKYNVIIYEVRLLITEKYSIYQLLQTPVIIVDDKKFLCDPS